MALALVGGAAIGTLFGALYDVVKQSMGRTVLRYKPLLEDLEFTLESLRPRIVQQIGDHNVGLGLPNDDIESLQRKMEEGIVLVRKLSNIGMWNCYAWGCCCNCTTPSYSDQLIDLNKSLRILLKILKLQQADDVKEILRLNREIREHDMKEILLLNMEMRDKQHEMERKLSDILKVQQEAGNVRGSSGSNTGTTIQQGNEGNGGHQVALSVEVVAQVELLGGVGGAAALGAALGVLVDTVARVTDKSIMLKRPLEDVNSTVDLLKLLIEGIAADNEVLNLPMEEFEKVIFQMEEGVELLQKCSKVRPWTCYKRHELAKKLLGLDESLQVLLNILRVRLARDVRERLVSISKMDPTEIEDVLEPPQPEVGLSVLEPPQPEDSRTYSFESSDNEDLAYMQQMLELKGSAGDKVVESIRAIKGASLKVNPVLIATEVRKIVSETEVISVGLVSGTEVISAGLSKEEIKEGKEKMEDNKEGKKERNLTMKEPAAFCVN